MPWIPLRIDPDDDPGGGIVRTAVEVNGRSLDLVLDTGAACTTIPSAAGIAELPVVRRSSGGTAFGRQTTDRVEVASLQVGGLEHGPLLVERGDRDDGQLGLDVLGRHRPHLDLDGGRLGLDEGDHVGTPHTLALGKAGHPHLTLQWDDISAYAVLDTGSSVTVVDSGFADRRPQLFTRIGGSHGMDATGIQQDGDVWTLEGPAIEDLQFTAHTAAVVDLGFVNEGAEHPVDLIVGYPLLRQAIWTLDFPTATWSARLQ